MNTNKCCRYTAYRAIHNQAELLMLRDTLWEVFTIALIVQHDCVCVCLCWRTHVSDRNEICTGCTKYMSVFRVTGSESNVRGDDHKFMIVRTINEETVTCLSTIKLN